ncbi:MAG: succinate dehydrogenase, hydrophobic membrane anchor protein [Betaproteobacteria bacterium]|nr:succinate dehydrogenase, hydrophobic membrane anchor protein [Betaproteobacteria bacterium]
MLNRIVVGAHYGLKDWIIQRCTAIVMALYTLVLLAILCVAQPGSFEAWRAIFGHGLMKFATFLFFISLFYHAWIGIRDIWMDYVTCTRMRLALMLVTLAVLVGYTGWVSLILGRL